MAKDPESINHLNSHSKKGATQALWISLNFSDCVLFEWKFLISDLLCEQRQLKPIELIESWRFFWIRLWRRQCAVNIVFTSASTITITIAPQTGAPFVFVHKITEFILCTTNTYLSMFMCSVASHTDIAFIMCSVNNQRYLYAMALIKILWNDSAMYEWMCLLSITMH